MPFKLPEFNRNWAVTPTAKISPMSALSKVGPSIAAAQAIGQTAQAISQTVQVFQQRENQQQVRDGQVSLYNNVSQFMIDNELS